MGRVPPRPKPAAGYTELSGTVSTGSRPELVAITIFAILILIVIAWLFAAQAVKNGSGSDEYFYHVSCYDDGRKTFEETLERQPGFNQNVWNRPGTPDLDIELPLESCILIQVERPSYIGEFGR